MEQVWYDDLSFEEVELALSEGRLFAPEGFPAWLAQRKKLLVEWVKRADRAESAVAASTKAHGETLAKLASEEARGRQYCLELAEAAGEIRRLKEALAHLEAGHVILKEQQGEDIRMRSALNARMRREGVRSADLETEIRLLRRERVLLIDLEKGRSRVIGSLLSVGGATADDVNFIRERSQAVAALHLEASGGIERPEGSACACILCAPQRTLGKVSAHTGAPGNSIDTLAARPRDDP